MRLCACFRSVCAAQVLFSGLRLSLPLFPSCFLCSLRLCTDSQRSARPECSHGATSQWQNDCLGQQVRHCRHRHSSNTQTAVLMAAVSPTSRTTIKPKRSPTLPAQPPGASHCSLSGACLFIKSVSGDIPNIPLSTPNMP